MAKRISSKKMKGKEKIKCLICGKYFRQLGSHVCQVHKMKAIEYRKKFGFDVYETRHTLVKELKQLYGEQALENKTYLNLKNGVKTRFKKNDNKLGKYERSLETMCRLKKLLLKINL